MSEYFGDDVELTCLTQTSGAVTGQAETGLQGYSNSHWIE